VHRWTRFLDSDQSMLSEEDGHNNDESLGLMPHRACPEGLGPEAMGHGASGIDNDDRLAAGNKSLHAETALCLQDLERSPESKAQGQAMTAGGGQIIASTLGFGSGAVNIKDVEQLRERALEAERMLKDMEMEVLMLVLQKEAVERQHAWERDHESIKVMRLEQALAQSQTARTLALSLGFPTETSSQVSRAPDVRPSPELKTGAFHLGEEEEAASPDFTDSGLTPYG
jgi:hypothetical protein